MSTIELTIKLIQELQFIIHNFFRTFFGAVGSLLFFHPVFLGKSGSFKHFLKTYPKYYIPAAIIGLGLGLLLYTYGLQKQVP